MSTTLEDECALLHDFSANEGLQHLVTALEADTSLLEPRQLRRRLRALDDLDDVYGDFGVQESEQGVAFASMDRRVKEIRSRLEAVNAGLYESIRAEIRKGSPARAMLRWIQALSDGEEKEPPSRGQLYDHLDDLLSGVLALREPGEANFHRLPEMVFYQPTPGRQILRLLQASSLSEEDVLVDLGSGLGHVSLLAAMLTGARTFGVEIEPEYVGSARECAESLRLNRTRFVQLDARDADLSTGTVFYLYSPFTGSILADVLKRLRWESTRRSIRICTLGPCTHVVAKETWLTTSEAPDTERVTVFWTSCQPSKVS